MSATLRNLLIAYLAIASAGCNCGQRARTKGLNAQLEIYLYEPPAAPLAGTPLANDAQIAWGVVKLASPATKYLALGNGGEMPLTVEDPVLEKGTAFRLVDVLIPCPMGTNDDPHVIPASECRTLGIQFAPSAIGDETDVLTLKSDDGDRSEVKLYLTASGSSGTLKVCVASGTGDDSAKPLDQCTSTGILESTPAVRDLSVDFGLGTMGDAGIKRRVSLTNTGALELVFDTFSPALIDPPDFSVLPDTTPFTLQPNESIEGTLLFKATDLGVRTATVTVGADDPRSSPVKIHLTATGQGAKLCISPNVTDFGSVAVGRTSPTKTVKLTNCGTFELDLTSVKIEGSPDFALLSTPPPGKLAPGSSGNVEVSLKPGSIGPKVARLVVESSDPIAPLRFALLKGNAVPPSECKLEASTTTLDFGTQAKLSVSDRVVTFHNAGSAECNLTGLAIDAAGQSAKFMVSSAPLMPSILGPNALVDVKVTYIPQDVNPPDNGVLTLTSAEVAPINIALRGTPTANPECKLEVNPAAGGLMGRTLNFGVVGLGDKKSMLATVKNVGSLACTIQKPVVTSMFPLVPGNDFTLGKQTPAMPTQLGPGLSATIEVIFQPKSLGGIPIGPVLVFNTSDGTSGECNVIGYNGNAGCKQIGLSGTAVKLGIDVVPNALDFGQVTVGCSSTDRTLTIYNTGGAAVTIKGLGIDPATAPFTIKSKPTLPLTLNPGNSASVTVAYRPTAATSDAAFLVISHDFSGGMTTIQLKGTGTTLTHQTDTFQQNTEPKADVLWVIDNSGSMNTKQSSLAGNAVTFMNQAHASGSDYQVAVTTVDWSGSGAPHQADSSSSFPGMTVGNGEFFGNPKIIRRTDPDPAGELAKNIKVGECCADSAESGLEGAKAALTNPLISDPAKPNSSFVRSDAKLAVIVLSDEEDQGASQSVQYYVDLFQQIKGAKNTALFAWHSIVGDSPGGCSGSMGTADAGKRYIEASTRTNGIFKSICSPDWGKIAADIGLDAFAAKAQYFLTRTADPSKLRVTVNGAGRSPGVDYDYDSQSNSIVFRSGSIPAPGATIVADYDTLCL